MADATNTARQDILLAHRQAHAIFSQSESVAATGWLQPTRERAMKTFLRTGFPASHDEDWKYTNLTKVADRSARYLRDLPAAVNSQAVAELLLELQEDFDGEEFVIGHSGYSIMQTPHLEYTWTIMGSNYTDAKFLNGKLREARSRYLSKG